jgi:ankyrin repeat protein
MKFMNRLSNIGSGVFTLTLVLIALAGCATSQTLSSVSSSGSETRKTQKVLADADWNVSILTSDEQTAIAYLRNHPGTVHDQEILGLLQPHGRPIENLTITAGFTDFMRINSMSCEVNCSIHQINRDVVVVGGNAYDSLPVSPAKRTGAIIGLTWNPGAKHAILGSLVIFDYCFVSDRRDPLIFRMIQGEGYVYERGSGIVVDPHGNIIVLGRGGEIHFAAGNGDLEKVKTLLKNNSSLVFSRDKEGLVPLHWAALFGSKEVVELLLANKADVNAKDNEGAVALHKAALRGHKDVAELLLANHADINAEDHLGGRPLHTAAFNDHREVAELLLANKADVNAKDNKGRMALHMAAFKGSKDVVELLLANKAVVNAKDDQGDTALHLAGFNGSKDVAELLLANKADVNAKDNRDNTPLHLAVLKGNKDVAELLRQHGGHE